MNLPSVIFFLGSACLGFLYLSKCVANVLIWTWTMFLRPAKDLRREYGSWAVITGCTDGIGKALAFELASKGLNLLLVGRNPSKLQQVSHQILLQHSTKQQQLSVKTVVIDLGRCSGEEILRKMEDETRGLDVGILVNNAGMSYPYAKYFHEVDEEVMEGVVRVNVEALTWLTKALIPRMVEKKKGAVVNIGSASTTAVSSFPLYTLYAASKGYVGMLSRSIGLEYKQYGIDVQCQIPLLVATKMSRIKKATLFCPSAETYGKASVRWIGHAHPACIPYWPHALQAFFLSLLPVSLLDYCLFTYFNEMRHRCLAKDR
ncbi:very-long-chain 3-oxoacyl-CoA reductase 1-like [Andrographis paniculata]|uniref:very-long-chain 3-oxoacyl-CoA reductase 1-like n=1 Tax=Andrographis paniculata TaxID=175694 RepID=UPI0021E8D990|nr:very-long-chain 3-oxoacyl-CoA reductase 1-like [Andrographis paniculata]